jgi:hypothetical protein
MPSTIPLLSGLTLRPGSRALQQFPQTRDDEAQPDDNQHNNADIAQQVGGQVQRFQHKCAE